MAGNVKALTLWPSQKDFFEAGPQPVFYLGGVGCGKTTAGILKIIFLLDQYPGSRAVIVRQKFNQLRKTILPTVMKLLPKASIARRNDNEGMLQLTNGSELLFMHLDREDSIDNLKSLEVNFCYVDQAEDISALAWDTLLERLGRWSGAKKRGGWPKDWPYRNRLGEAIPPRYALASGYSPGYDHWITARWWEQGAERELYRNRGYIAYIGSTRDNLALSEEYIADRLAQGEEYTRRYVDAVDWGAKEGRIFTLLPASIVDPTDALLSRIKRTMRLHRGLDHGEASPTACLWYATDARGNVFVYREYVAADKLVSEHRAAIYELSRDDGFGTDRVPPTYHSNVADPSIFNNNRGRTVNKQPEYSVADEYVESRIVAPRTAIRWSRANNDEAMTINRVREYLRADPNHINPITGKPGGPRIYFLRQTPNYPYGCKQTIVDIRSARRVVVGMDVNGNKLYGDDRDDTIPDHCLDVVRYLCGSRPALGPEASLPPPEPGTIRYSDYEKAMDEADREARIELQRNYRGKSPMGY